MTEAGEIEQRSQHGKHDLRGNLIAHPVQPDAGLHDSAADAVKTPQPRDENAAARDRAIQQGTDWLTRYFAVGINPGEGSSGFLDYLNGMARVGRLSGLRFFGQHDWYRDEAAFLVGGQSARDGSWQALDVESDKRIATSLALLFLCETSGSAATIKVNDARPQEQKPRSEKSLVPATASGLLDKGRPARPIMMQCASRASCIWSDAPGPHFGPGDESRGKTGRGRDGLRHAEQ